MRAPWPVVRRGRRFVPALLGLVLGAAGAEAQPRLTVYTAVESDEIARITSAFAADRPKIQLEWVRDSTDRITDRLLEERRRPRADIVWGLAATSIARLAAEGYFEPYRPEGFDELDRRFSDPGSPPLWTGLRAWANALCVNPERVKAAGRKPPARWGDLLDPAWRGEIVAPDPGASRTGYMALTGWISLWRESGAWNYMDGLHRNVAVYTRSGIMPCNLVARGEYAVGLSSAQVAARLARRGKPVTVVLPVDGVGWDVEAMAIVRDTPARAAARAFADWSAGERAMRVLASGFGLPALPGAEKRAKPYPEKIGERLVPVDFTGAARDRTRLLADWRARFGAKAAPDG